MALTLADASRLAPLEGAIDPEFDQWRQANEIAGTSEVGKGWRSAGLGSRAAALYTQSLKAANEGDAQNAEVLRQQAEDLDQQTAAWAPRVQNVSDVRSLRDAADWGAGALGNVRTSVAPALGSLAGAGVGLVAAPFTAGVVNPVNAGFAGGAIAGYDAETEEAVAAAMRDPYIMANHTPAEILAASRIKGGLNSLLEAAVPTVMGGKVMGTMGKGAVGKFFGRTATKAELTAAQAAERAGQRAIVDGGRMGAAKAVGASTLEGGVGEFGTEFTQSLTGQGTQNYLQDKGVTDDLDYMQALNEGAAGAVAGGGMGIVGGGGEVARAHMASTKDAVAKVARDPVGAAADFVADAGHTAGKVGAKLTAALERLASPDQRAFDTLLSAATPEQHAAAATQWAQHVLNDKDSGEADRAAAADYVTRVANGDPKAASVYRDQLTVAHHEGLVAEALGGLADEIEERQPKQSRENMTVAGDLSSRLAELWLGSEGKGIGLFKKAGGTSEAKRAALMLTEWVRSGFGAAHNDGETFVPKRLIEDLGDDAPKVVLSLAKLVKKQGVFTGDDASILKMHDEVKALSQDNSTDTNIIDQMLTPLAHAHWNDSKTNVVAKALRESNGKVSEGQRKALEESFGPNTDAVLKHFREKAVTPKYGKQLEVEAGAPSIDEEGTVSASTDDYESGLSETTPASKVRFQGVGANNVPFNTLYADKKASHDTLLSTYKNQQGAYARSVGVHDALKEQYGKDHPYMREAENEALWNAVKKVKSSNAERDAYMTHLESLTPEQRDSQLKALNKTHKLLRVEEQGGNETADKITPDKVEGFREKRGARSEKVTPADGVLYLERKTQTDKESGEQTGVDEDFLTSTHRLIQHTYDTENRESEGRTKGSAGRGVKGEYEALLRGLAALVESDGTFTGRVGFRTTPESEVVYRASTDKLPKQLKLRSGTVEDANARAKSEMKAGQPMNFTLREVVSNGAKREELRRLSNTKNISYPLKQEVDAVLASKSGASVETLYDRLYSEWNKADAELGEVIPETTDKDLTPTEFANEPEMHRDSDGQRKGLGVDASGYEGASRGGRTTDVVDARGAVKLEAESRPADEPARKKVRKLGDQLDARDWVADLLRKGTPAFNAARLKYAKDADVMKRVKAGIRVLTQMAPRGLIDVYDGNLTVAQAETIISRAKKAMGVGDVRNNDAGVETEVRGRVDAVGRQGTEEAGAAPDKRGSAPKAELGKPLGLEGILSAKELDDAIYDEDYGKLDSVAKLQQFATYTRDLATRLEAREEAGEELSKRDEGLSSLAGQLVFEAKSFIKNPDRTGIDFDSFFDDIKHTDEDVSAFVKALAGVKQSTQTANDGTGKRATKAERDAAKQHILDTVGDTVKGAFVKHFGDNSSGSWTPGETQNVIRLALNGNVLSTSYHESMHEFFAMLKKYGNTATVKLLERVASNEILNRKLERLLADHPEAAAQVRESPEEAAAFLYQFWRAGQVKLGEETTGFFQKIKNLFSKITGKVSQLKLDEQAAQRVLEAFSRGDFKSMNGDTAVRDASMEALRKDTAMHEKVLDNLDKAGRDFTRIAGKLFFSSEAMLKGTKNKYMVGVAELLHQETGTARGENQGLLSAVRQHSDIWLNKLNNILTKYKPEDLELARQALSKGVPAKDRIAKEIVEKINAFNEEMYTYISSRDVRRLDPDTNKWVKVERRKGYFTRVWDTNAIQSRTAEFKELLFKHHRADLEATAKIANNEVAAFMKGDATFKDLGPAANTAVQQGFSDLEAAGKAMGRVDTHTVTAEMVADAIITRLLNAKGHADLDEGGSDIGMTPLATSVNRRSLSWINDKHFDDFKSKDITNIMTSYVSSMVKRAEYTKALGHGSEKLRTGVDKAILYEMGGDELVKNAERRLPIAIRAWGRAKAAALKAGEEFTVPYPTLRSVGLAAHNVTVSSEQVHKDLAAALKHLDQGFKAIQAQEGTLGSNISAGMKSVNNVLMTYQTVRLLPLVMFSSVNDVMGIVAQGGELKDAWDALVGGMREIKLRWKDEKSQDYKALRAEGWGTVDAGSLWDTLGQAYGSSYMSDAARKFADGFFKWNGMEGWNRAMRITATSVAERALKAYQKVGFDKNDKAAKARFEELYGKNFDPKDIALDADGELDMNDVNNQAAMMRWVSSAIMSPNAAHRTIWGSDPRMASFWMLKQFAYTFHRVMLKGAIEQAKLGNYRPAVVLALGYAPVTIAADAVKEMLIPGEEPPWMQGGLDGFLAHGFDRAGVAGVPGMAYDALTSFNGPVLGSLSAMGGPTVGQLTSALVDSPSSTLLGAAPLGSLLRRAAE